jgi:hypothetical protein
MLVLIHWADVLVTGTTHARMMYRPVRYERELNSDYDLNSVSWCDFSYLIVRVPLGAAGSLQLVLKLATLFQYNTIHLQD